MPRNPLLRKSHFGSAGNAGTNELIARCPPGYFFLPSLSVLLIFPPPPDRVHDGPDDAGQIGRGTQDFKNQIHRPLQSEIEALPADGFRGGQDSTPRRQALGTLAQRQRRRPALRATGRQPTLSCSGLYGQGKRRSWALTCDLLLVDVLTKHQRPRKGTRLRRSDRGLRAPCTRRFPSWEQVLRSDSIFLPWPMETLQGSRKSKLGFEVGIFTF